MTLNGWWTRYRHKRATDVAARVALEAEVIRLNKVIQDKTIPALIAATEAMEASNNFLRKLQEIRGDDEGLAGVREPRVPLPKSPSGSAARTMEDE